MDKEITNATRSMRALSSDFASNHNDDYIQLWTDWISLWNGEYGLAANIISSEFYLHASLLGGQDPSKFNNPASFVSLIDQIRTAIPDMTFTVKVGPLIDTDHIVGHWAATGHYAGHFPGAEAETGTEIAFNGTDILRIERDVITEYWLVSETLDLLTQLRVKSWWHLFISRSWLDTISF